MDPPVAGKVTANFQYGTVSPFEETEEKFDNYMERLEFYFTANEITDEKKKSIFLSVIGSRTYETLKHLLVPETPNSVDYQRIVQILSQHFSPQRLIISERFKFYNITQSSSESINNYVVRLKEAATHCNFDNFIQEALRDRFVCGLCSYNTRKKLLAERNLTFTSAYEIALALEVAESQNTLVNVSSPADHKIQNINKIVKKSIVKNCIHCNKKHGGECRYKSATCYNCKKPGHITPACKNKRSTVNNFVDHVDDNDLMTCSNEVGLINSVFIVNNLETSTYGNCLQEYKIGLSVNDVPITFCIDTGCAFTLISKQTFSLLNISEKCLQPVSFKLKTYLHEELPVLGEVKVDVKYKGSTKQLPLVVLKQDKGISLLGRLWLSSLKETNHFSLGNIGLIENSAKDKLVRDIKNKFASIFNNDTFGSTIKDIKAHIILKEGATPVFCKARTVPYALKSVVEKELKRLCERGILYSVTNSDWCCPIVCVPKKDTVRICCDFSSGLNKNILTEHYPLPNIHDLLSSLGGNKVFCLLDLSNAFHQLLVDEGSQKFLTINTHVGLFRYKTLPYGIKSAPSIFQFAIDKILSGLSNVKAYIDDILIYGSNSQDCETHLIKVLERLKSYNVKVNIEKCKFFETSIDYLGYRVDEKGLHPLKHKCEAIANAPNPENVTQLKAYLGLLSFYSRFLPNMSTVLQPLYELLKKNKKWSWTKACERSFKDSKQLLLTSNVLVHYDQNKPLFLSCDSSQYGIGCTLSQEFPDGMLRPISFASKTLSSAEKGYANIEREALSIIFGLKKFYKYLWGKKFILLSDNKPLTYIFNPLKAIPAMTAARLQRWALMLSSFDYEIRFCKGSENVTADGLSRLPLICDKPVEQINYSFSYAESLPLKAKDIAFATKKDATLIQVKELILNHWPEEYCPEDLLPYFRRKSELSLDNDCIVWGNRIVIPKVLRKDILKLLHEEHPGILRLKALARSYVWFPNIDSDIEQLVRECQVCQSVRNNEKKAPLTYWPLPIRPFQRIHLDFAQFEGKDLLIVYDAFSKFIDVKLMNSTTTEHTIAKLRTIFSYFGLVDEIVSDNGPQFVSEEFNNFCNQNGIKHNTSPPYHPQSNGGAERTVQTVKNYLMKQKLSNVKYKDFQHRLDSILFNYRNIPHSVTGKTPNELLFSYQTKTKLNLLKPNLREKIECYQNKQKQYHDNFRKSRDFEIGNKVWVKSVRGEQIKWFPGVILNVCSPYTFIVETVNKKLKVHKDHIRVRIGQSNFNPEFIPDSPNVNLPLPTLSAENIDDKIIQLNEPEEQPIIQNDENILSPQENPQLNDQQATENIELPIAIRKGKRTLKPIQKLDL